MKVNLSSKNLMNNRLETIVDLEKYPIQNLNSL